MWRTGVGDIAPSIEGQTIERTLTGVLTGLIVVIVVAVMFVTAEYRRGLIRTTLIAIPRRGRILVAKSRSARSPSSPDSPPPRSR